MTLRRDDALIEVQLSSLETTVLLTVDETMDALRKAKQIHYRPPGA